MDAKDRHERTVFSGRRIELRVVELGQGGSHVQRELIVHPGSAVILALTAANEAVMIRNRRFAVEAELWELPAGTLEPPERPEVCAARELAEETGYQAENIEPLGRFYSSPGFCTELIHAFLATDLSAVGQRLDAGEEIRVELLPIGTVRRMIREGEIIDGKTLAALCLYSLRSGSL